MFPTLIYKNLTVVIIYLDLNWGIEFLSNKKGI